MNAILLAAGYGTRLYPLTKHHPKALLPLGPQKVVLDVILENLRSVASLRDVVLVSNHLFIDQFREWNATRHRHVKLVDDGTSTPETRLGAINDLVLGLSQMDRADDVLVVGTDNVFTWLLQDLVSFAAKKRPAAVVAVREVPTNEEASQLGVVELDANARILRFLEKPADPPARTIALCVYVFPLAMQRRLTDFVTQEGNADAPGFFIEWLVKTEPVYGYLTSGEWLDIGTHTSYDQAVQRWAAPGSSVQEPARNKRSGHA